MSRRRFYAPPNAFSHGQVTLTADEARHLSDVLRLQPGDEAYVFDGVGDEFQCVVDDVARDSVLLSVRASVAPARPESPLNLALAVALLKGDKFDLVVQKTTELGISRILPIITDRADIKLRDESDGAKRVARWQRIALEAAKQSGRARVPEVESPLSLVALFRNCATEDAVPESAVMTLRLLFSERAGGRLEYAYGLSAQPQKVTALIGSEGGWTDDELELARMRRWQIVTLGGRTLRAETAAIAVTTLLQHRFGDLV